jgi:hypothetical protein
MKLHHEDISSYIEEWWFNILYYDDDEFSMDAFIKKISDGIKTELEDVNLPTKEVKWEWEKKLVMHWLKF